MISFIPYLGTFLGVVLAVLAALEHFHDGWHVGLVLGVFSVGHRRTKYA
ncbi:MAG: hypothetical protein N3A55_10735 [Methylohalobius sp.]|nr:hypothetical protein [Methylohalobius sp.]